VGVVGVRVRVRSSITKKVVHKPLHHHQIVSVGEFLADSISYVTDLNRSRRELWNESDRYCEHWMEGAPFGLVLARSFVPVLYRILLVYVPVPVRYQAS